MKAIVVRQPWATLLVDPTLPKWIETRSQATRVRGRVAIVAGATTRQCWDWFRGYSMVTSLAEQAGVTLTMRPLAGFAGRNGYRKAPNVHGVPFGAVIGTVDLYACVPILDRDQPWNGETPAMILDADHGCLYHDHGDTNVRDQLPLGDFRPGRWAWLTRDPILFAEPIPYKGRQGWFEVEIP